MGDWSNVVVSIVVAIIGLATLSVILSSSAKTSSVIQASTSGLSTLIQTAVSPVSGFSGLSTSLSPLVENQDFTG